jgi:hypothetical protein
MYVDGGSRVNFQNGYMTWMPWVGFKVFLN